MKTALVCIAKDEDYYLDEWIRYHTKLGFDHIFVYQNNWRYQNNKDQFNNVHWIVFDGDAKQLEAYQNFIIHHSHEYDWAAFFDVDEFLCLKTYNNVKEFLKTFEQYNAVGINWRFFGNNAQTIVINDNYSVLDRFITADYQLNKHIKTILHTSKTAQMKVNFQDPHCVQQSKNSDFTVNSKKSAYIHGPFNEDVDNTVQLNHYYSKTLDEYLRIKRKRGRCDQRSTQRNGEYDIQKFSEANKNDVEDLTAKNFYFSIM